VPAKGATVTAGQLTSTAAPKALAGDHQPERDYNKAGAGAVPTGPPPQGLRTSCPDPPAETRKMARVKSREEHLA
jgi:hypothetical protein